MRLLQVLANAHKFYGLVGQCPVNVDRKEWILEYGHKILRWVAEGMCLEQQLVNLGYSTHWSLTDPPRGAWQSPDGMFEVIRDTQCISCCRRFVLQLSVKVTWEEISYCPRRFPVWGVPKDYVPQLFPGYNEEASWKEFEA